MAIWWRIYTFEYNAHIYILYMYTHVFHYPMLHWIWCYYISFTSYHIIYVYILNISMYVASCFPDVFLQCGTADFVPRPFKSSDQAFRDNLGSVLIPCTAEAGFMSESWEGLGEKHVYLDTFYIIIYIHIVSYSIWGKICLYTTKKR
jgi:hypothetical protein